MSFGFVFVFVSYKVLSSRRAGSVPASCSRPLLAEHCKLNLGLRLEGRTGLAFGSHAWVKAGVRA